MVQLWKKKISVVNLAVLLSTTLGMFSGLTSVQAQAIEPDPYRIVALGDSLTVGYEPEMDLTSTPYGFVDRLHEQGLFHSRTETINYGILGLKGTGLEHFLDAAQKGVAISAEDIQPGLVDPRAGEIGASAIQLKADIQSADLITITIGGNDLGIIISEADNLVDAELNLKVEQLLTSYKTTMTAIIENLHEMNKDALIVVADQYQPIPEIANRAMYPKLINAANSFTGVVEQLVTDFQSQSVNIKIAHVAEEFVGGESTMTHIIGDRDIHPNQLGYGVMAEVFAEVVWGEYLKPSINDKAEPMTIVVKGKELKTPYQPVLRKNQNFVAIKDIVDAIGATSVWDSKSSSATITYGDRTVVIKIGSSTVTVNGESIAVTSPAFLHKVGTEGKTYVPLAVIATGLGFDVQYIASLRTAFINQ
ncbi:stalk domain-containing protein [Paenibacillus crassostreae]|uniref:Copper amine oxidase n=1 Tax=Paenibacillus crassostreae TaxID=1763538 RepID=A0A167CTK0_9BACL|nr:stalk domain-containing protein [Paenibacillus crassostreae]AOZ93542.1 copper amine oxidase [Paenibacillus crassostreae]OAB73562.1 copper amine oxidase [Paenibacillus crassostreae]